MNLVPIDFHQIDYDWGRQLRLICVACGEVIKSPETALADLDGTPFKSYYHDTCVRTKETES